MNKLHEWTVVMYGIKTDLEEENNIVFGTAFPKEGETLEQVTERAKENADRAFNRKKDEEKTSA